jgi:hypothetical protein
MFFCLLTSSHQLILGVVKSFVAGGYVLRIQSKPAHDLTGSLLSPEIRKREQSAAERSLDKSWQLLDVPQEEEFLGFEVCNNIAKKILFCPIFFFVFAFFIFLFCCKQLISSNQTISLNKSQENVNNDKKEKADDDDDDDEFGDLRDRWLLNENQLSLFASALQDDPEASVLLIPGK